MRADYETSEFARGSCLMDAAAHNGTSNYKPTESTTTHTPIFTAHSNKNPCLDLYMSTCHIPVSFTDAVARSLWVCNWLVTQAQVANIVKPV